MRIRAPLLLSALLLGCSSTRDPAQHEADIVRPGSFRAGSGVITSVGVLRGAGSGDEPHLYRLHLLMDAGGFQTVDIDNSRFFAGEAVELTSDGRVVRVSGTSFAPKR
jgi:hypothetical protein